MTYRVAQLGTALLCLAAISCAAARSAEPAAGNSAQNGQARAGANGLVPAGAKAFPAAGASAVAGIGGPVGPECWGPGIYGYGKGSPRLACCAPFHEFYIRSAGYDQSRLRVCVLPIEGSVGCINGTCGDGICEVGEDVACGCSDDCPDAAWEGTLSTPEVAPDPTNGFSEVPASCTKPDLLAHLQTSRDAIDCGNLSYKATDDEKAKAFKCVQDAFDANEPFQVFWETLGTDSVNPNGLVARLQDGMLHVFSLDVYTGNEFGLGLKGSTALWQKCRFAMSDSCTTLDPLGCFGCGNPPDRITCECLPAGKRPNAPDGTMVELRCKRDGS
jgi:hypothetical protein